MYTYKILGYSSTLLGHAKFRFRVKLKSFCQERRVYPVKQEVDFWKDFYFDSTVFH